MPLLSMVCVQPKLHAPALRAQPGAKDGRVEIGRKWRMDGLRHQGLGEQMAENLSGEEDDS